MRPARCSMRVLLPLALAIATPHAAAQVVLQNLVTGPVDDAEITPDGSLAVTREHVGLGGFGQLVRVLDVRTGAELAQWPASVGTFNGAAQDAVAVTNERALVIGASAMVLDLTLPGTGLLAEHPIGFFPRDLAITPDGTQAVVRGGDGVTDGLFVLDLLSGAIVAKSPGQPTPIPSMVFDVDSAVATDRHGVLLSWVPAPEDRARVTVFDLKPAGGGAPVVVLETGPGTPAVDQVGRPHDLALTADGHFAAVRSELSVALYKLDGAASSQVWHERLWGAPGPFGGSALDSIEASAERVATISRRSNGATGAQLDVFDLAGNQWYAHLPGDPHDLEITPDGTRVLVRTSAGVHLFDLTQLPASPLLVALDSVSVVSTAASFGAGLDSVAVTDARAVTLHRQALRTEVRLWDLSGNTLAELGTLDLPNKPCDVAISPDGRWAAVTGTDHLQVIDLTDGRLALDHEPALATVGQYPWCDGVVLDDERVVAFGYSDLSAVPNEGWISVVDLDPAALFYCSPGKAQGQGKITPGGSTSISTNQFSLHASGVPGPTIGGFVAGTGSAWQPLGVGTLCVGGTRKALGPVTVQPDGAAAQVLDFTGGPAQGGLITAGSTWYFQLWYRDVASGGLLLGTTDAMKLTFQP